MSTVENPRVLAGSTELSLSAITGCAVKMAAENVYSSDSESEGSFYGFTASDCEDNLVSDTDDDSASFSSSSESEYDEEHLLPLSEIRVRRWRKIIDLESDSYDQNRTGVPEYSELYGPKNIPDSVTQPVDYVSLLLGEYVDINVDETNKYGDKKAAEKNAGGKEFSRFSKWRHTNVAEIKAFLGLVLNMGLVKKSCLNDYWSQKPSQQTPYFSKIFTRDRFMILLSCFHTRELEDNLPGREQKVKHFIDYFCEQSRQFYTPHKELSVDESLVGFQGRANAIQYMPQKHHHKFGIKIWNLCESVTGFTLNANMYPGKTKSPPSEHGLAFEVVRKIMEPYLGLGHHLYVDNFFTSLPLAEFLIINSTYLTGTLRANRKYVPDVIKVKQKKGQITAARSDHVLCVNWFDKKPVFCLSTNDTAKPVTYTSKRKRTHTGVPHLITSYNKYMGGVDMSDMRCYMFLDERRTLKWTNKMKPKVGQYVRAIHDFKTAERGEISLQKGDVILVSGCVDDNWLCGRLGVREGSFPYSFVELIQLPSVQNGQKLFLASENFPAQVEGDLEFRKGDIIIGTQKIDSNWWKGCVNGSEGIFPLTHAILLETLDEIPSENVHEISRQTSTSSTSSFSLSKHVEAKALVGSTPQLDDELGFRKGDTIFITEVIDADWYRGECKGHSGIFLSDCVQVLGDLGQLGDAALEPRTRSLSRTTGHSFEQFDRQPQAVNSLPRSRTASSTSITKQKSSSLDSRNRSASYNSENTRSQDNEVTPYAKTLYPFVSQAANELTFMDNEIVKLFKHVDNDWIEGELDGQVGLFPASFVEIIVDCPYDYDEGANSRLLAGGEKTTQSETLMHPDTTNVTDEKDEDLHLHEESYGLVLYDFIAESTRDLNLYEGDTIIVLKKIDDNWLKAKDESGNVGMCPLQFVEIIGAEPVSLTNSLDRLKTDSPVDTIADQRLKVIPESGNTLEEKNNIENKLQIKKNTSSYIDLENKSSVQTNAASKPTPPILKPLLKPKPELKPKPALAPKPAMKGGKFAKPRSRPSSTEMSPGSELQSLDIMIKGELLKSCEENNRSRSSSIQSVGSSGSGGTTAVNTSLDNVSDLPIPQPARPKPPKPAPPLKGITKDSSFYNKGYVDDSGHCEMGEPVKAVGLSTFFVDHLVWGENIPISGKSLPQPSRKPLPTRRPPAPPIRTSQGEDLMYRKPSLRKPPPPRPTGPRVASAPPKTVLTPLVVDPTTTQQQPEKAGVPGIENNILSTRPSRPAPPRPAPRSTPPRRPPPKPSPRSPTDLMSFSPNSTQEKGEEDCEAVADLRKRIAEVQADLEKYIKSQRELEMMLSRVKDDDDREEIEENLEFYQANITGFSEELTKLSADLHQLTGESNSSVDNTLSQQQQEAVAELRRQEEEEHRRRREEEERKRREEMKQERQKKRQNVIDELLQTERDYLLYLHLVVDSFLGPAADKMPAMDMDVLFGNMEEIADVAQKLLTALEGCVYGKEFSEQVMGGCFVKLAEDMKNAYAPYCRNHDDVHVLLEKYEDNEEIQAYVEKVLDSIREKVNVFDLGSLLIKPVQRILKYPLLLNELLKTTEDDHEDKKELLDAINSMTDVATAINEYKRRKDLVFKYKKETDEKFGDKIAKLNLHSLKKKSTRLRARLSTNLGISLQTKDETFHKHEARFRAMDKIVKGFVRDVQSYVEQVQEGVRLQDAVAADVTDYYDDRKNIEEVVKYQNALSLLTTELLTEFRASVEDLVIKPLNQLASLFDGPSNVIQKRFDKLLDYDSLYKKVKDDKSKVAKEALQAAKNDYEAMNAQLLDELPKLHQLSFSLLKDCMSAFVWAERRFTDCILKKMYPLLELPMLLITGESVMETFNIKHVAAVDRISHFSFIPKGFNPRVEKAEKSEKRSKRNSLDPSMLRTPTSSPGSTCTLPPISGNSSPQSPSQKIYVQQSYQPEKTYKVLHNYTALNMLDLSVWEGDFVGVIKTSDPMGDKDRWFVDNGEAKGFVPKKFLTPLNQTSPRALDFSDVTSVGSGDGGESECRLMGDEDIVHTPLQVDWSAAYPSLPSADYCDDKPDSNIQLSDDPPPPYPDEFYSAEYGFSARNPNEVSLFEGQVVSVISKKDQDGNEEWWWVDADGHLGFAPAAYLRKIEENIG